MKRPLQLPLAIALALGATNVLALGLGPVHVKSRLNQPLDAEIPIIEGNAHDADGLLVSLAGADDFERVGLSRSRLSVPLEFTVVKGAQGGLVIKVTSKEPVRAAYLDFLVEANWTKGRLLREYTVLLDPPMTAPATRSVTTAALAESPGTVTIVKHTQPVDHAVIAATPVAEPAPRASAKPAREASASKVSKGEYGPVSAGETLSEVARATRVGTGADLDQMMLALLKNNPNAFYKDNINALKRGAILRVPSTDAIKAVGSVSDAASQVRAQVEDWRGGRAAPTLVADTGSQSPAPNQVVSKKSANASASVSRTTGEHLELVPPKTGKDSVAMADRPDRGAGNAAATSELKSELARTKESLTTREQESGELKSKVKELEGLNGKNDRLINLKNSEIADLQQKLKQLQEKSATAQAKAASAALTQIPTPAPTKPKATESAPLAPMSVAPAAAPLATAAAPTEVAKMNGQADKNDIAVGTKVAPTTATLPDTGKTIAEKARASMASPPAPASGPVSTSLPLAESPPTVTTPHPATDVAPPVVATVASKSATPIVGKPAATVAAPWYEAPWAKPAALGAGILLLLGGLLGLRKRKDTPPAGRSSIADAFGDSPLAPDGSAGMSDAAAAEEADLREQLHHDPANVGLHLELLSLYYAERDVARFEDQAAQMHEHVVDPDQPEWQEAEAMGQELAPDNPLFAGAEHYDGIDAATATAHTDTFEPHAFEDHATLDAAHDVHPAAPDYNDAHLDADRGFDSNHIEPTYAQVGMPVHTQSSADVHPFDFEGPPPLDPEAPIATPMYETTTAAEASAAAAASMTHIDEDDFAGGDAIGTKLDLAKAYMDMGDPEGARSMLEEVVAEGTDVQKAEAHRLMADMG